MEFVVNIKKSCYLDTNTDVFICNLVNFEVSRGLSKIDKGIRMTPSLAI